MVSKYFAFTQMVVNSKEIENLANKLKSSTVNRTLSNFTNFLKSLEYTGYKKELFRKRNSVEILASGFLSGCTDAGLLFCSLCKNLKIPVRYVETITKSEHGQVEGHIFVDVYFDKQWHKYNPLVGQVENYNGYGKPQITLKGLDFTCLKKGKKVFCLDGLEKLKELIK